MSYLLRIAPRLALASLGAALTIAAACADQQPTSPALAGGATRASSSAVSSVTQPVSPQAKPTDQVGFTTVEYVEGQSTLVGPGQSQLGLVLCPTGSKPTGAGFRIVNVTGTTPTVTYSRLIVVGADSGWSMIVTNKQTGAGNAEFLVDAVCVH
jgi:hypothetical protein